jgi:hypothetical protein
MASRQDIEKWTGIIEAARRHPGGVSAYMKENGIKHASYYSWFKRLKNTRPDWQTPLYKHPKKNKSTKMFVPLKVTTPVPKKISDERIEIKLANGRSILLPSTYSGKDLAALLVALEGAC